MRHRTRRAIFEERRAKAKRKIGFEIECRNGEHGFVAQICQLCEDKNLHPQKAFLAQMIAIILPLTKDNVSAEEVFSLLERATN